MSEQQEAAANATQTAGEGQQSSAEETLYGISPKQDDVKPEGDRPEGEASKADGDKPEEKPEGESKDPPAEGDKPKDGEGEAKPELKVEDLKVPEGFKSAEAEAVIAFAKEHGLDGKAAQAVLDFKAKAVDEAQTAILEQAEVNKATWLEQVKADPHLGGEHMEKTSKIAKAVIDKYATPQLKETLNKTGLGNFPDLVRMLVKMGDDMKIVNDEFVRGANNPVTDLSPENVLYPKQS